MFDAKCFLRQQTQVTWRELHSWQSPWEWHFSAIEFIADAWRISHRQMPKLIHIDEVIKNYDRLINWMMNSKEGNSGKLPSKKICRTGEKEDEPEEIVCLQHKNPWHLEEILPKVFLVNEILHSCFRSKKLFRRVLKRIRVCGDEEKFNPANKRKNLRNYQESLKVLKWKIQIVEFIVWWLSWFTGESLKSWIYKWKLTIFNNFMEKYKI